MKNRAILSRIGAKKPVTKVPEKTEGKAKEKKVEVIAIETFDAESGDLVIEYASLDEAVEAGFNRPNIQGALKNGNKYKGLYWKIKE